MVCTVCKKSSMSVVKGPFTEKLATATCRICGKRERVINPPWLRHMRELAGIKLRAFAGTIGKSENHLSNIELGHTYCTLEIKRCYEKLAGE